MYVNYRINSLKYVVGDNGAHEYTFCAYTKTILRICFTKHHTFYREDVRHSGIFIKFTFGGVVLGGVLSLGLSRHGPNFIWAS